MNDEKQIHACANMHDGMMCGVKLALAVMLVLKDKQTNAGVEAFVRIANNLYVIIPVFVASTTTITGAVTDAYDTTKMVAAWEVMGVHKAVISVYMKLFKQYGDVEFTQEMVIKEVVQATTDITNSPTTVAEQSETIQ